MLWLIGILKFIFAALGMFMAVMLILAIISSIINPQMSLEGDKVVENGLNARYMMVIIMSIAWAIVIALP